MENHTNVPAIPTGEFCAWETNHKARGRIKKDMTKTKIKIGYICALMIYLCANKKLFTWICIFLL